ncbi:MAG TPA: crosslink repair DNA glycosylase YcaQ family protein [Clostridia bacterium]|nr:crosslink repair DNA glycosylase YcaQ family protein [Clostridia bacterium]HPK17038.1 crosslink repair DNA glycosylase YcaQ family protein [Clostridia bacterium]
MGEDEIRLMRLVNQHLIVKTGKIEAIRDTLGYQAQYFGNSRHAARIRTSEPLDPNRWGEGLYRSWTLRGTLHVFAAQDLPLFFRAGKEPEQVCESAFFAFMRARGYGIDEERARFFARLIVDCVSRGAGEREALRSLCRETGMSRDEEKHLFNPWGGVIRELAENGTLCLVACGKKEYVLPAPFAPLPPGEAETELARRYFAHFGPATLKDAAYFFGKPQKDIKAALDRLEHKAVSCGGKTLFFIESGRGYGADMPACVFLAGFDQLMLGYEKSESLFLAPEHIRDIFNLAGIVFPALLLDGRAAGRWKEEKKSIRVFPFSSLAATTKRRIVAEAARYWADKQVVFE